MKHYISKKLYFILMGLSLLSCKKSTNNTSFVKDQATEKNKIQSIIGGGNEPGWSIKVSAVGNDQFVFSLTSVNENGVINGSLSLTKNESQKIIIFDGVDDNQNTVKLSYIFEECLDMAANKNEGSLELLWKGEQLEGCGNRTIQQR